MRKHTTNVTAVRIRIRDLLVDTIVADSSSGRQVYPSKVCRQRNVYSLEKKSEEEEGKEQGEIRKQKKK